MRRRMNLLESAVLLFVVTMFLAFFLVQACGCGLIAGLGRDITAMAEGGATKAADDAAKINGKGL